MTGGRPEARLELHDGVGPLAEEWAELACRTGASPFVRPGWMDAWYGAFASGRPVVAGLRRAGALTAVAALEWRRGALRSATNWHTPEYDVVAEAPDDAAQLARLLVERSPRRVDLRFLAPDGHALRGFEEAARTRGYRLLRRTFERSPYVAVAGDWDDYRRRLKSSFRKDLDRRRRRLVETGEIEFTVSTGLEHLEEGLALEAAGWKGRRGTAILSRPETRAFYTAVASWAAERGLLRLAFLRVGGKAIAFEYALEADGVWYDVKPAYDEEYARYAPGKLIVEDMLRRAFAQGARTFEFLGAADGFKLAWTDEVRERVQLQAFAPTAAGLADWLAFRAGRPAAKRARALVRRG